MQKQSDFQGISYSALGSSHVFLDNSGGDFQNFPSDRNTLQIVDTGSSSRASRYENLYVLARLVAVLHNNIFLYTCNRHQDL